MKIKYTLLYLLLSIFTLVSCCDKEYVSNDPNAAPDAPACYDVNDLYQSYKLFFKPAQGWVGDPMPYFENGKFHVFYLQDARDGSKTFHPWHEASTSDLVSYSDDGEMIPTGTVSDQDAALGTGSVIKDNGLYYAFYTGHNGDLDPKEKVLLATSPDLKTWTKDISFEIRAEDGYDRNEFRDPLVIKDESTGKFKMYLSTRADYKGSWRAVIAQYSSTNLRNWTLETPIYDDPDVFMIECPDIFIQGNYQYIVYSNISDRMVHYKYRQIGATNWITPPKSNLDGKAYYAGRTASNGANRYLFGWCATRTANNDYSDYSWGGSLVTHQLIQNTDGTLNVKAAESITNKLSNNISLQATSSNASQAQNNTYTLKSMTDRAYTIFDRQDGAYTISAKIKATSSTNFGFEFGSCGNRREVFTLTFDLEKKELKQEKIIRGEDPVTMTSVSLPVPTNKEFDVTIVVENSVCVIYVNNEIAFSNRIYKMNNNPWGIFANNGDVTFSNLSLHK